MKTLERERVLYTIDDFIESCEHINAKRNIALTVWDIIREQSIHENYKPKLEDNISNVLCIAEEELDEDIILVALTRCNCRIPSYDETKKMPPIITIKDIVLFVSLMESK